MGADIHLYIEKCVEGRWRPLVPPTRDLARWPLTEHDENYAGRGMGRSPFWGPSGCMSESRCYGTYDSDKGEEIPCVGETCPKCLGSGREIRWYRNRNYEVFGVLAGVRRPDMPRIDHPRGLPADLSPELRDHGRWDHTPSWLTAAEVMTYDWDFEGQKHRGLIPVFGERGAGGWASESFESWIRRCGGKESPEAYCQGMSGHQVSVEEARRLIALPAHAKERLLTNSEQAPIVWVEWREPVRESCRDFVEFVDEFVEPLLGQQFADAKAVVADIIEQEGRRTPADDLSAAHRTWPTTPLRDPRAAAIRAEALAMASRVRLVFGFDS